jgi:hypothetical protein
MIFAIGGDAALGFGAWAKLANGAKQANRMRYAIGAELFTAVGRSGQAVYLVITDDYTGAAGCASEALLRFLGARWMKKDLGKLGAGTGQLDDVAVTGARVDVPSGTQSGTTGSQWLRGRYTQAASKPNAYWESGRRVFPTKRNSGLSGARLRAEQKEFFRRGLAEGKDPAYLRGQAAEAGYERRGGWLSGNDRLAYEPAEKALQEALEEVRSAGVGAP